VKLLTDKFWLPALLVLGACSSFDSDSFRMPDMSIVAPRTTATLREKPLAPITNEDLIGTDGSCAGVPVGPDPNVPANQQQPDIPLIPSGIALEMSECEVVRRAGHPEKFDFGSNERGERTAVLTYVRGPRPGVYHFAAGRLKSIERAPEPPPPPPRNQRRPPPRRTSG
jgi:hypothetical protein